MVVASDLKVLHDRLLASKPDGAEHDSATCPVCALELASGGEQQMSDQITAEERDQAIADAVATAIAAAKTEHDTEVQTLRDELAALQRTNAETEVGQAVAEAVAPLETQIAELQSKLDDTEARATAAEQTIADATAYAEALEANDADFVAYCERLTARDAAMKDAGIFSDEYITENLERFTAMEDDTFVPYLADLTAAHGGKGKPTSKIPSKTSMVASDDSSNHGKGSALAFIGAAREAGTDFRSI